MSYLTTKLYGIYQTRQLIGRIISNRCFISTSTLNRFNIDLKKDSPISNFTNIHQTKSYSTIQSNLEFKTDKFDVRRVQNVLTKLASNKVSIQFDKFGTIRQSLFRNYDIGIGDGFEILKSCSQLINLDANGRLKLVNECWNELISMIKTPTKNQLILLLKAYRRAGLQSFDNYDTFFNQYNCPIDLEIFAELMYITCQNNDTMDSAEKLLKEFQSKNLMPNEQVYAALILGYSKHGIEAIENVLTAMKSNEITPSLNTHTELIKAYLVNGMHDKAMAILQHENGYSSDQLYDIIRCASIHNNEVIIEKALNYLPDSVRNVKLIVPNLQNICIELVYLNQKRSPDTRLDPYKLIIRHLPVPEIECNSEYGIFLLNEMLVANESVENILRLCNDLIEDKRNLYAIHNTCMYSLVFNLPVAYAFLEALAAKEPLRPHYFWPLIVRATNQTETINVIQFATKLNVILDTHTIQTYVLSRVNTLIDSQETIKVLMDAGIRMLELKTALIAFLLDKNRPKEALNVATRSSSPIDESVISPTLCKFIKSPMYKQNAHTVANLVKKMQSRCHDRSFDLSGQIILSICNNRDKNDDFLLTKRLLTSYAKNDIKISFSSANQISNRISNNRKIFDELNPIIQNVINNNETLTEAGTSIEMSKHSKGTSEIEALEQQLAEFRTNNLPTHGILYRLLLKHVQLEQYTQALDVKKQCDEAGVIETPAVLSTLIKLWTATNQTDKALSTLENLQKNHPNFKIDVHKIVDLATVLITENRLDDAKKLIHNLTKANGKSQTYISYNLWHLLNAASEYGVSNKITENISGQLLRILIDKGYCEQSNTLLGTVIKEYLDKKQIHEAVAAFEQYVNLYNKTPQSLSLLTLLIELSNSEDLTEYSITRDEAIEFIQQIIELQRGIYGTENTNVSIILAFACAGNEQQLRKILMNPVVKFNVDVLLKSLVYLKDRARIDAVVSLARSARGLQHDSINEEKLYEFLLSDFVRTNDYAAAIQLYEQLQNDDNTLMSRKFCKTLADLLEKNNQPLPDRLRIRNY